MKELVIGIQESGQRLDKYISKYLNEAPKSFIYKMMRKKNITLNDKKCEGSEILNSDDKIKLWLSDETIDKFRSQHASSISSDIKPLSSDMIVYEDDDIMILNKPAGILSQKAKPDDISMVERLISYLLKTHAIDEKTLETTHPSICNRLDRNTSGLLMAGKTLIGLQTLSELIRSHNMHKDYLCIVGGQVHEGMHISGFLTKGKDNKVTISETKVSEESAAIDTIYKPVYIEGDITLMMVRLITGKSHQIRAHLASVGHPILGDIKYGDAKLNQAYSSVKHQLLHAYKLTFPLDTYKLTKLSGASFTAEVPTTFKQIIRGYIWEHGKPEDFEDLPSKI